MSPVDKIPPVENGQNHAQKSPTGDTGGIGDILHTPDVGFEPKPVDEDMNNTMRQEESSSIWQIYVEFSYT